MQLIQLLATTLTLTAASVAPNPENKPGSSDNLARGYGYCNEGGYWYGEQCYCHERNYGYCDDQCVYKCYADAYWDYNDECCYCYNSWDYSHEHGCTY